MDILRQSNHIFVNGRGHTRIYIQGMEKRRAISIKLPPHLIKALDDFCQRQTFKPTRTEVIEEAIRSVIGIKERKDRK